MSQHDEVKEPRDFSFFCPVLAYPSRVVNSSFEKDFRIYILEKKLSQITVSHFFLN